MAGPWENFRRAGRSFSIDMSWSGGYNFGFNGEPSPTRERRSLKRSLITATGWRVFLTSRLQHSSEVAGKYRMALQKNSELSRAKHHRNNCLTRIIVHRLRVSFHSLWILLLAKHVGVPCKCWIVENKIPEKTFANRLKNLKLRLWDMTCLSRNHEIYQPTKAN